MANFLLRKKALELRLQGYTYGQIKRELGLPKSTLSDWLQNLSLTEEQLRLLAKNRLLSRDLGIEKYRLTRQKRKIQRLQDVLKKQQSYLLPLTTRELFLAGVFLYWGEGSKQHGLVSISNSDPKVIKFALYWLTHILRVPKDKLKVFLHLYQDMDIKKEIDFWSKKLIIPKSQFRNPYIKNSTRDGLTYKSFGHGTCNLVVSSVELSEKIAMSIKAISDYYGEKNDIFWYN